MSVPTVHREPMSNQIGNAQKTPLRVLVVDDEMHLRLFIKAVFESAGYAVTMAANGEAGIAAIRRELPDLVSLDLMMPGQGGVRLLQELRQDPQLAGTRVMVVSAIDDETYRHAMALVRLGAGDSFSPAEGYVAKPPTADAILREAERILRTNGDPVPDRKEAKDGEENHDCG